MKVQILYRNYKPLHKIYESLVMHPPKGIEYIVPPVKKNIGKFKFLYRRAKHLPMIKLLLDIVNNYIFVKKIDSGIDIVHLINVIPGRVDKRVVYVLEAEHAAALTNFTNDKKLISRVINFIQSDECKAVICTSNVCRETFKWMLEDNYKEVQDKFHVVYPAVLPISKNEASHELVKKNKLNFLFVGNDCYRKGIVELLEAFKIINNKLKDKIELHIISNDALHIVDEYNMSNVYLYEPEFSKKDIITKFFLPADLFIMPTKLDTFGMVIIDSLASGTPVLTTRQFAIPEIVKNEENGLLVELDNPLLDMKLYRTKEDRRMINSKNEDKTLTRNLVSAIEGVLSNPQALSDMSNNAASLFESGKFSIDVRNEHIRTIYNQALTSR